MAKQPILNTNTQWGPEADKINSNFTELYTNNTGINTGDETASSIVNKIGNGSTIASQYLPAYVDDVLEFSNLAALPAVGETGKIYITLDTNFEYRWSGSVYIRLVASPGSTDAVPEGTINKYFTDERAVAATGIANSIYYKGSKTAYGAKADAILLTNGATVAGSNIVNCVGANFTSANVGKVIAIPYAGADNGTNTIGQTHLATITAVNSATQVTISVAAVKTIVAQRTITDAAISANGGTLTSATAAFTPSDVGKKISIPDAGELTFSNGPAPLPCYISGYISATQVTVTRNALQAVSAKTVVIPGAWVQYGTDDSDALQAGINETSNLGITLLLENGRYLLTKAINPLNNTHITGASRTGAILSAVGSGYSAIRGTNSVPILDVIFENFTIDGYGVTANSYSASNKGIFIVDMIRPIFRDLIIMETSATGLGCDLLIDYEISNNVIAHCGRQVFEFGSGGGGSGIGIGTGKYTTEAGSIFNNHVTECGKQGIFVESQSSNILSRGIKITHNNCDWCGNSGIGDHATDGTVIAFNSCNYNRTTGIGGTNGFVTTLNSINSKITANICKGNGINGILYSYKSGGVVIENNTIESETNYKTASGIALVLITGGTPTIATIRNNMISRCTRGINISGATQNYIEVDHNKIFDGGTAVNGTAPAIWLQNSVSRLYVRYNICADTKAPGSKTQGYGFTAVDGITITKFVFDGNDFDDNVNPGISTGTAVITTQITHFNP